MPRRWAPPNSQASAGACSQEEAGSAEVAVRTLDPDSGAGASATIVEWGACRGPEIAEGANGRCSLVRFDHGCRCWDSLRG